MGLSRAAVRFLAREHRRRPFGPALLTLGRQFLYVEFDTILEILRQEGLHAHPLPEHVPLQTNIPAWKDSEQGHYASDLSFFHSLGIASARALDADRFEGADIVWDLNQPVGEELAACFDTILDPGTLEHVFDIRTALVNVNRMLKPGGRVLHFAPCNNYANHGFYQFSPTWFLDYYQANGYTDIRVWIAEQTASDYQNSAWNLFEIQPERQPVMMCSRRRLLVIGHAQKTADSTVDAIPVQSYYRSVWKADPGALVPATREPPVTSIYSRIKRWVPVGLRHRLRKLLGNEHGKPWCGLRRGRLS